MVGDLIHLIRLIRLVRRSAALATCKTKQNIYSYLNLEGWMQRVRTYELSELSELSGQRVRGGR